MNHVYAVTVPPNMSDDPIRFLFANEMEADLFAKAINGDSELQEAVVTYEPIAYSLDDTTLNACYGEEAAEARRLASIEA